MVKKNSRNNLRKWRKKRGNIFGTEVLPRLSVFRSNKNIFAQLVNDEKGTSLAGVLSSKEKEENKTVSAFKTGEKLAEMALKKGITRAVFDRSGYKFHGRIKALLEGAEKAGINFRKLKAKK
jgi:large subunit ribosomal protein L18